MNLVEAIEFPVFVNGLPLTASVIEVEENPVQYTYKIQFSNGYEDIFTLDEGMIEADKGESSKPYLKAIRTDIGNVIGLDTNKFYHIFQDRVDHFVTNIWVIGKEDENGQPYYGVYYNEHYRFEVRKINREWLCSTRLQEPGVTINKEIADKVIQLLYSVID